MPEASVFTLGDNAYFFGNRAEYDNCYKPRWGRFLSRTYPSPGNHEYENGTNGSGYFDFFGGRPTGDGGGYYSYTLGNWHVIALNSGPALPINIATAQYQWLKRDLEANKNSVTAQCTLAYWHHPVFTSGPSAGSNGIMRDVFQLLWENGVDVVVNGHDHLYERFFPQDHIGRARNRVERHHAVHGRDRRRAALRFWTGPGEQREQAQGPWRDLLHAARCRLGLGLHRSRHRNALRRHLQPLSLSQPINA